MKKIQRPPIPIWLKNNYRKWKEEYAENKNFSWPDSNYKALLNDLAEMTQHHCAFCDDYLLGKQYTVEHFRPLSRYPDQAFEWDNLFLCCSDCQSAKGNRFDENLLKPDDPRYSFDKYFAIDFSSGELMPNPQKNIENQKQAEITIDIFSLNRFGRPRARLKELQLYLSSHDTYDAGKANSYSYRFFIEEHCKPGLRPGVFYENGIVKIMMSPIIDQIIIEYIRISDIKCFDDIRIDFHSSKNTFLIVGPNARGKSAILQLIALGLNEIEKVPFPQNWKKVVKAGKEKGRFEVGLKITEQSKNEYSILLKHEIDKEDNIILEEGRKRKSFKSQLFLLGYGVDRQLKQQTPGPYREMENIATLFGESCYLKNIKISETYKYVSENFNTIRHLINAVLIEADKSNPIRLQHYDSETFWFETSSAGDERLPLEALSEGFKSAFSWIFDMIVRIAERGKNVENSEEITGIVLLDEIDLHLHPSWQRTILPNLEKIFPKMQFIATTHSPFVVQSAIPDSLVILEADRENGSVKAVKQDITSELSYKAVVREVFGIQSPFSHDIEKKMNAFHEMRDAILRKEDVDKEKLKNLILELANEGVEVSGVIRREIKELERRAGESLSL